MTVAEARHIFDYWADNPPVHLMVQAIARMLGWKPAPDGALPLADVAAMALPGLSVTQGGDLGMPAAVLDVEALRSRNREYLANRRGAL